MRDKIIVVHGAPFPFVQSPLDTYIIPLLKPLGIEIVTVERADPISTEPFDGADRAYGITHSHGTNWLSIVTQYLFSHPQFVRPAEIGWSSLDGVRFADSDDIDSINPTYEAQTKNIPFQPVSIVNTTRAYHRKLPFDRKFAAAIPFPVALLEFPFNSLFVPSVDGQDVVDVELDGTVGECVEMLASASATAEAEGEDISKEEQDRINAELAKSRQQRIEGEAEDDNSEDVYTGLDGKEYIKPAVKVWHAGIDHNMLVAACADQVVRNVKKFFGLQEQTT